MSFCNALQVWLEVLGFGALLRFGWLFADYGLDAVKQFLARFRPKQ